jgi:uncharacterized protein (TIGR00369 family)
MLELMERIKSGEADPPPIAKLVGFTIEDVQRGRSVVTLEAGPQHWNPMGTVHGGVFADVADAAMGIAFASTLAPGETFTTVELKMNYLRPVKEGMLIATAEVVHRGRTIGLVEASVLDGQGRLVAKVNSTCMVLRGEQADGRSARWNWVEGNGSAA